MSCRIIATDMVKNQQTRFRNALLIRLPIGSTVAGLQRTQVLCHLSSPGILLLAISHEAKGGTSENIGGPQKIFAFKILGAKSIGYTPMSLAPGNQFWYSPPTVDQGPAPDKDMHLPPGTKTSRSHETFGQPWVGPNPARYWLILVTLSKSPVVRKKAALTEHNYWFIIKDWLSINQPLVNRS